MSQLLATDDSTLYEQVARRITDLIDQGTLRPGDRVPSVRKLSRQLDVSISTVLQAYRILEDRGRIEARPQSGYYVKLRLWQPPQQPEMTRPAPTQSRIEVGELVMSVIHAALQPDVVPLGAALGHASLFPLKQLNRLAAAIGRRSPSLASTYDMPPGCPALRVQVARRALECGCTLRPDEIVTTIGGQEALMLCLRAVTRPGDAVAIESPTFYGILQAMEVLGLRAVEIPTCPNEGLCLKSLTGALRRHAIKAVLVVGNYNNPLGSRMPDEQKMELVKLLGRRQIPLIEDDVYGDLGFGHERPRVCKAFDQSGLVLHCSSFSKTLAPGYRVGWCAPGRFRAQVERLKFVSTIATPTIPQMAIAEFLASGGYDHHLRKVRKAFAEQIARMTDAVSRHFPAGTKVTRPQGGFVLWVELPKDVDALELHERAVAHKISIAPGPMFSAKGRYRNFIRLNCGHPWSDTHDRAVKTLGRLVAEM